MCHIELLNRHKEVYIPVDSDAAHVISELSIVQKGLLILVTIN